MILPTVWPGYLARLPDCGRLRIAQRQEGDRIRRTVTWGSRHLESMATSTKNFSMGCCSGGSGFSVAYAAGD